MYICICKNISDKTIKQAIDQGACSLCDIHHHCSGAGSVCGKCKIHMQQILETHHKTEEAMNVA